MSARKNVNRFFKQIEKDLKNRIPPNDLKMHFDQLNNITHLEWDFVILLIGKLRREFNLKSEITEDVLEEMLKGGHLKLHDNGTLYDELLVNFNTKLKKRSSSHDSICQQYSLSGPVLREVLIGASKDEQGNKATWIQFERHHTKSIIQIILHLLDYLQHKLTGKNIGPFGTSEHTEQNPIIAIPGGFEHKSLNF